MDISLTSLSVISLHARLAAHILCACLDVAHWFAGVDSAVLDSTVFWGGPLLSNSNFVSKRQCTRTGNWKLRNLKCQYIFRGDGTTRSTQLRTLCPLLALVLLWLPDACCVVWPPCLVMAHSRNIILLCVQVFPLLWTCGTSEAELQFAGSCWYW